MNEDLKTLNDILLEETYNDKVLLEIKLGKISDKKLVIGLLLTILNNLEKLGANKENIMETLSLFVNKEDLGNDYLKECHDIC